jgi:hypothetical protein
MFYVSSVAKWSSLELSQVLLTCRFHIHWHFILILSVEKCWDPLATISVVTCAKIVLLFSKYLEKRSWLVSI